MIEVVLLEGTVRGIVYSYSFCLIVFRVIIGSSLSIYVPWVNAFAEDNSRLLWVRQSNYSVSSERYRTGVGCTVVVYNGDIILFNASVINRPGPIDRDQANPVTVLITFLGQSSAVRAIS